MLSVTLMIAGGFGAFAAPAQATASWSPAVDLSEIGSSIGNPAIAGSGTTAIGVWAETDSGTSSLMARVSTDAGVTWQPAVSLVSGSQSFETPSVAASGSRIVIVWSLQTSPGYSVPQSIASQDGGATWGPVTDIVDRAGFTRASYPVVGLNGTTAVVTWSRWNPMPGNQYVQAASSSDGGATWGTTIDISPDSVSTGDPDLVVTSTSVVITWWAAFGSGYVINSSSSSNGGVTWSAATWVHAPGVDDGGDLVVQTAGSGQSIVAVWGDTVGSDEVTESAASADGGLTWSPVHQLSDAGQSVSSLSVTMTGADAYASWQGRVGASRVAQVAASHDGGLTWAAPSTVSAAGEEVRPSTISAAGSTVVVAMTAGTATVVIEAVTSTDSGATWSSPVTLSVPADDTQFASSAIASTNPIVVWRQADGATAVVQASTFAEPGAGTNVPHSQFTFRLADGQECSLISPQTVVNGSAVALPGADAQCTTPGAELLGWRIPGRTEPLPPGQVVLVVDSQQFTAILREPLVVVHLGANVADSDSCVAAGADVPAGSGRLSALYLQRPEMSVPGREPQPSLATFPAPATAPCTPPGHRLIGWNTNGAGTGLTIKVGEPMLPAFGDHDNAITLHAMWAPASAA